MTCEDDLFCGIKSAKSEEMSDLEKKHTPVIDSPDKVKAGEPFDVTIEVGKLLKHPNEEGHHFQWIELWYGDTFIFRYDLTPVFSEPKITAKIMLTHPHREFELRALARCNLHGVWEGKKKIEIVG